MAATFLPLTPWPIQFLHACVVGTTDGLRQMRHSDTHLAGVRHMRTLVGRIGHAHLSERE